MTSGDLEIHVVYAVAPTGRTSNSTRTATTFEMLTSMQGYLVGRIDKVRHL